MKVKYTFNLNVHNQGFWPLITDLKPQRGLPFYLRLFLFYFLVYYTEPSTVPPKKQPENETELL